MIVLILFLTAQNLVLRLLLPSENYLTILIKESLTNYSLTSATEVIFSLRSSEIPRIKGSYSSQFGRELKDDIENFTFGEQRKVRNTCFYICSSQLFSLWCIRMPRLQIFNKIGTISLLFITFSHDNSNNSVKKWLQFFCPLLITNIHI